MTTYHLHPSPPYLTPTIPAEQAYRWRYDGLVVERRHAHRDAMLRLLALTGGTAVIAGLLAAATLAVGVGAP